MGVGVFVALSSGGASPAAASAIRAGVGRYLGEPAIIYPICVSARHPAYAKVGVYPIPVSDTFPFQAILRQSGSSWRVVAWRMYDPLGWLDIPGSHPPTAVVREPWCRPVPHTPGAIRAAVASKAPAVSTFGMTFPYVPEVGPPVYKPASLGYSGDGGAIYYITNWISYGDKSAKARATWDYNPCHPSCANNQHYTHVAFVFTLTHPKPCVDVVAYTTFTVVASNNTKVFPKTSWSLEPFCR